MRSFNYRLYNQGIVRDFIKIDANAFEEPSDGDVVEDMAGQADFCSVDLAECCTVDCTGDLVE